MGCSRSGWVWGWDLGGMEMGDPPFFTSTPKNWDGRAGMQWRQEGCPDRDVAAPVGIWGVQLGLEPGSWGNGDWRDPSFPPAPQNLGWNSWDLPVSRRMFQLGSQGMEMRGPLSSPAHQNQGGESWDVAMPGGILQLGCRGSGLESGSWWDGERGA